MSGVRDVLPGEELARSWYRLPRRAIGELRFLLEGYDGLGFVRTLDAAAGVVEIACPASRRGELAALLEVLAGELAMVPLAPPETAGPL